MKSGKPLLRRQIGSLSAWLKAIDGRLVVLARSDFARDSAHPARLRRHPGSILGYFLNSVMIFLPSSVSSMINFLSVSSVIFTVSFRDFKTVVRLVARHRVCSGLIGSLTVDRHGSCELPVLGD